MDLGEINIISIRSNPTSCLHPYTHPHTQHTHSHTHPHTHIHTLVGTTSLTIMLAPVPIVGERMVYWACVIVSADSASLWLYGMRKIPS